MNWHVYVMISESSESLFLLSGRLFMWDLKEVMRVAEAEGRKCSTRLFPLRLSDFYQQPNKLRQMYCCWHCHSTSVNQEKALMSYVQTQDRFRVWSSDTRLLCATSTDHQLIQTDSHNVLPSKKNTRNSAEIISHYIVYIISSSSLAYCVYIGQRVLSLWYIVYSSRTMTQHFWKSDYHILVLLCVFNIMSRQLTLRTVLTLMMSQGSWGPWRFSRIIHFELWLTGNGPLPIDTSRGSIQMLSK